MSTGRQCQPPLVSGGWSGTMGAYPEIQKICNSIFEKATVRREDLKYFYPIKYRMQMVAGTNYCIKVHVGDEKYVHITVFQALSCDGGEVELTNMEKNQTLDSPLVV